ncbi:hypothetical protein M9H77_27432 [Catharanthus roseus]|uniref:Uncharacterized protein n=1 Tax=Catharanthus roseus TaxID=4058 RepID=A0ACC0ADC9_CATRO|nr:hypothetical protein M9H77_27432 [Catharanthus roseus]
MAELLEEEKMQLQNLYYKSLSLKEKTESKDTEQGGGCGGGSGGKSKSANQSKKKGRESSSLSSPGKKSCSSPSLRFSNLFRKKTTGFTFGKWKSKNIGNVSNVVGDCPLNGRRNSGGEKEVERKEMKSDDEDEDGGKEGGYELCKKRILMGGKCKPLNLSGKLRYDENGILLPEEI